MLELNQLPTADLPQRQLFLTAQQKYSIKSRPHLCVCESKAFLSTFSITDDDYRLPVRQPDTAPSSQKSP